MANPSPNSSPKPYKKPIHRYYSSTGNQKVKKVQRRVIKIKGKKYNNDQKAKSTQNDRKFISQTVAIAFLLASGGVLVSLAWVSILFIFNPSDLGWLNQLLPVWARVSLSRGEPPQTLTEITTNLKQQKLQIGETIPVNSQGKNSQKSFLLPVLRRHPNCQSNCEQITELRIYQQAQEVEWQSQSAKYYYLVTKLPIVGPEESFVTAPLSEAERVNQSSNISLPLSKVGLYQHGAPSSGFWFYLQGKRQQGTKGIAYGHIVFYNPQRDRLQQMLSWTSPSGKLPQWQQITGDKEKELVVEQTIGLEPLLKVYQLKPIKLFLNPFQLQEITLEQPAMGDGGYEKALVIARSGLWTPAWQWLQFIKKQRQGLLPGAAQQQVDLIRLHSKLTKVQADKNWAAPSQQVLAYVIDGRWEKALQTFTKSPQNSQEIANLLKADGGRLWKRTQAALKVNPKRAEVQIWGALILAAQAGEKKANSWLNKQSQVTSSTRSQVKRLLAQLNGEVFSTQVNSTHPSRIVGTAKKNVAVKGSAWLPLDSKEDLVPKKNQIWSEIEVIAFHDGEKWRYLPFENLKLPSDSPSQYLQKKLGIQPNSTIDIITWLPNKQQQNTIASLKAVKLQNGVLTLLATTTTTTESENGNVNHQLQPLAMTHGALEWVQPSPMNFELLYQQQPEKAEAMIQRIWRLLQTSGDISPDINPHLSQLRQQLANLPVQILDVTNDNRDEIIVTIPPEVINIWKQANSQNQTKTSKQLRTLIFSDNGKVIYSEFKPNNLQILTAIAKLPTTSYSVLLVENRQKYTLQRWSEKNQRFE
ncbi:hypothetical protein [Calothrix rhizosoleniae]|uniref:hypothetical protein n=1 Tax=Calothrix rhizosoleniae TaxID=888997 RepID=UPI00190EB4BE|nr:hypothetical protein [Calothrix rhizosoleniae]